MKKLAILIAVLVAITVITFLLYFRFKQSILQKLDIASVKPTAVKIANKIPSNELDPQVWGQYYPEEYASYLQNAEISQGQSKYRGSVPFSYLEEDPIVKRLFAGIGFGIDYNNKRGHFYALEDVQKTKRVTNKTTASCWTCKSPNATQLISEMGDSFYKQPFKDIQPLIKHPVSCVDCHDSRTMQLKVTRQPFLEALKAMGKDPNSLSQTELRSAVCGQCHSSYYLNSQTKKVVFPWKFGLKAENLEQYYRSIWFTEWSHPESKAPLIKARHPEYETWSTSVHASNKVACADCHMPKERMGDKTIASHHWQSPLNTIEFSCRGCHKDTNLKDQVITIQDEIYAKRMQAEKMISEAIDDIKKADNLPNSDGFNLMMARAMHRRAQWRWDFVASENSMGFHNPEEARRLLDESVKLATDAKNYAKTAIENPNPNITHQENPEYGDYKLGMGSRYLF
ncbi:MAG: ammonia-forming cytochrome c nitrite reductase subunit c552 [Desulfitobacteriaceae bacterium]